MSQKLIDSYVQFLDGNGNPLAGGSLVFSETGTDTPKTVYAAENQTTPLGSEVTLDASGRPSSGGSAVDIYSAATGAYRMKVRDSSDVVQVTTENLSALLEFSAITMTGQFLADDATGVASPPIGFDTDPDTGIARPAANTLATVTGGVERTRVTSGGDFGVGTTTPEEKGHFAGNLLATGIHYSSTGTFTVTSAGTTTEVIDGLADDAAYLVSVYCAGVNMELSLTGLVLTSNASVIVQVATLASGDFNVGSVALQTKGNASAFTFSSGNGKAFQFVMTGDGSADQTAVYRLLRIA